MVLTPTLREMVEALFTILDIDGTELGNDYDTLVVQAGKLKEIVECYYNADVPIYNVEGESLTKEEVSTTIRNLAAITSK